MTKVECPDCGEVYHIHDVSTIERYGKLGFWCKEDDCREAPAPVLPNLLDQSDD